MFGHVVRNVAKHLVLEDVFDVLGLDISHLALGRIFPLGGQAHGNVTVGDNADQTVALTNRQDTGILIAYKARCVLDRVIRCRQPDTGAYHGAHHGTIVIPAARARLELLRCWSWFWTVRLRHVNSIIQSCD